MGVFLRRLALTHEPEACPGTAGISPGKLHRGRPLEPEALGWIGLFSKWKNILLLLSNLSLLSKMGKSLQTDKLKGE